MRIAHSKSAKAKGGDTSPKMNLNAASTELGTTKARMLKSAGIIVITTSIPYSALDAVGGDLNKLLNVRLKELNEIKNKSIPKNTIKNVSNPANSVSSKNAKTTSVITYTNTKGTNDAKIVVVTYTTGNRPAA